jgi:hypothetical protein
MALQKTVTTPQGFTATNAYHRVEAIRIAGKTAMQFNVYSHIDGQTIPFFAEYLFDCPYDVNGANPLAQAYEHLKIQPEFAGATDC